jgi:radical SAM superfamily enzyme YgiQ (UPF0313 family)
MDVLFVDVPNNFLFPVSSWCLGYRYLISILREDGFSASLLSPHRTHNGSSKSRLIADILQAQASIVGFTTYDIELAPLLAFICELRRAGLRSHITLGGLCASAIPAYLLERNRTIDSVVAGEGELSVLDLARYVIRKEGRPPFPGVYLREHRSILHGEPRPLVEDLDTLPLPALDDLASPQENSPLYSIDGCAPVVASKGCYGRCTFCSIQRFYRSCEGKVWRGRHAERIASEIAQVTRLTGLRKITFVDENFMGPGNLGRLHAAEIAQELKKRRFDIQFNFGCRPNDVDLDTIQRLKEAGLAAVSLGIESMSAETLSLFNKLTSPKINSDAICLLEEHQIFTEITFIFFHPLSTIAEIRENLAFIGQVRSSKYAYFNNNQPFTGFIPFFGTDLTEKFKGLGLVKRDLKGYSIQYQDPRVGFIARRMLAFPLEYLTRMHNALPNTGSSRLIEIKEGLQKYKIYLSMVRLPDLVSDLCDLFETGVPVKSRRVAAVTAAVDQEALNIQSLIRRFSAHLL